MTRYFFNIRRDVDVVVDPEGDDFQSLEDARSSAIKAIRELVAARLKGGETIADECIEIVNEAGAVETSVSFHDVVRDHLRP